MVLVQYFSWVFLVLTSSKTLNKVRQILSEAKIVKIEKNNAIRSLIKLGATSWHAEKELASGQNRFDSVIVVGNGRMR